MSFFQKRIDNSALVLFRICFGILMAWQSFCYLQNGWIRRNLTSPEFTFSHIGMEWLQPLPGNGMNWYFAVMGISALCVAIGFRYRFSIFVLTFLWSGIYFMQKTVYNNHFYLLILIGLLLLFMPANAYASLDARNPKIKSLSMPAWCGWVMILQMAIVYFFASVAKLYPGWLNGSYVAIVLTRYSHVPGLSFFADHWFHVFIAWTGMLFDLIVIPMFLFRRTRLLALLASILFHTFNFFTLKIGIFPFLALSFAVFFFEPESIRRVFFWKKPTFVSDVEPPISIRNKNVLLYFFLPYFIIQLILPIRHWFIKGDVLWTEEGHRLSWRMMLRHRTGSIVFHVIDAKTGQPITYDVTAHLTPRQFKNMLGHPDMIWQTAQHIKSEFQKQGTEVRVFVDALCSVNKQPSRLLIDRKVDLAHADWNYFGHCDWILLYPETSD
ncbi:HTTM domain-containing protein [Flavobacterium silvaticum]|uniref:HTTM domain-containing protein n=1 Tax=Flavobacterium silvaticum TaxID=1852020 RepID=A0A972FLF4_9FLAO|nr:HTTM domain-containing protein [Flavobacterium silvaticum]NMH27812.1 HTTM domain-containing protein [Flavobacterium silvaticum]